MKKDFLSIWNLTAGNEGEGLDRFRLRMSEGDFIELLGAEESGKTALAGLFSGKEKIRGGSVRIGEKEYYEGDTLEEAGIFFLGEKPSLAPGLTVAENIAIISRKRRIRGIIRSRDIETRVNFLLSEFGIGFRADIKVSALSEGEMRLVELMRAVENEFPFVVIDDVLGTLGQTEFHLLEVCLLKLKEKGITILIIGGGFPLFANLDDRMEVLRHGRHARTFYRENFDRETYVKWIFGVSEISQVRSEAVTHLDGRKEEAAGGKAAAVSRGQAVSERKMVLQIRHLETLSLSGFSLNAAEGEIIGLYDMDNTGNREVIGALTGENRSWSGEILLDGRPYRAGNIGEAIKRGVTYLPRNISDCSVVERMSYADNLTLSSMKKNSFGGFLINRRVSRYLAGEYGRELDNTDPGKARGGDLGAYDRMRVALQRLLLQKPRILAAEDILSDMNVRMLKLQTEYFARLTSQGCAVIISSRNLNVLRQVCDRITVINTTQKKSPPFRK